MKKDQQILADDVPYMDDLDAVQVMTPSRASELLLFFSAGFVVFCLVWASFSRVDEVTRGSGQVVPTIESQVIQSLEGGIVQELLAHDGDAVKKGQVLIRLRDIAVTSEARGAEARSLGLKARKARLEAEASGVDLTLPEDVKTKAPTIAANEMALYQSRQKELENALSILDEKIKRSSSDLDELRAQISRDSQNIGLLQQELTITSKMVAQNAVPKIEEIRLRRELSTAQGSLNAGRERQSGLEAELSSAKKQMEDQRDKFRSQALGELNQVETDIAGLSEAIKTIDDRVDRAEIRSPVDGIVNNMAVSTIGGIVEPAMKIAEIVPVGEDLKITARVTPDQIAFLKTGQPARVKITAYDSQRYGFLTGKLTRVGASSVSDPEGKIFFEIDVRTDKGHLGTDDHPLPITPGMVAEVDVITGKRTILQALMRPVLRLKDRALTER